MKRSLSHYVTRAVVAATMAFGSINEALAGNYVTTAKQAIAQGMSPLEQAVHPSKLKTFLESKMAVLEKTTHTPSGGLTLMVDDDYASPISNLTPRRAKYDFWANDTAVTGIHQGATVTTNNWNGNVTSTIGKLIVGTDSHSLTPVPGTPVEWNSAYVADLILPDGTAEPYILFKQNDNPATDLIEFEAVARLIKDSTTGNIKGVTRINGLKLENDFWELIEEELGKAPVAVPVVETLDKDTGTLD